MADLKAGVYEPAKAVKVIRWPAPDKDGPGNPIWVEQKDVFGRVIGREQLKDKDGNVVKTYPVPSGFVNMPNSEGKECWVQLDDMNQVRRQPETAGETAGWAYEIQPGTALVESPNGSVRRLTDEYDVYTFLQSHNLVQEG